MDNVEKVVENAPVKPVEPAVKLKKVWDGTKYVMVPDVKSPDKYIKKVKRTSPRHLSRRKLGIPKHPRTEQVRRAFDKRLKKRRAKNKAAAKARRGRGK